MALYHFDGTITKEVSIWVEADSMEEAEEKAQEACENGDYDDGQSEETCEVEFDCIDGEKEKKEKEDER